MGILKTAATVAVASSVHGRIQRRQAPAQAPSTSMSERLAQLSRLSDLKSAGVLTDAEFDEQKARILNG